MVELPDGTQRLLPGQTIDLDSGFCQPWFQSGNVTLAAGGQGTVTFNFAGTDFIYYIDEIHITPSTNKELSATWALNAINAGVACSCGYILFTPRTNPSIFALGGDSLTVVVVNLDSSQRTISVLVNGTKMARPSNFGRPPYALFTGTPLSLRPGQSIQMTDASLNSPTDWKYYFNNVLKSSGVQNPSIQLNDLGTYDVVLTVTNAYGYDTYTRSAYVTVSYWVDLTTFTKVDPGSCVTVTTYTVTVVNLPRNTLTYVYKDYGANYFDNIELVSAAKMTSEASGSYVCPLMISNSVGNLYSGSGVKVGVAFYYAGVNLVLQLLAYNGTTQLVASSSNTISLNTEYYLKLRRASGATTVYLDIYTDSNYTNLFQTINISNAALNAKFEYLYMLANFGDSGTNQSSLVSENLIISNH